MSRLAIVVADFSLYRTGMIVTFGELRKSQFRLPWSRVKPMSTVRRHPRSKRPMPGYTKEVMEIFLNNPDKRFLKSELVSESRSIGVALNSHSIAPPVKWLFDYGYIIEAPGPGRYKQYYLKPEGPEWPPVNVGMR